MFNVLSLLACLAATGICQAAPPKGKTRSEARHLAATGILQADPLPVVTILAPDPVATEGDHRDPARLTLVRSGSTASSLAVRLLISGTATPGTDYLAIASPITIPAGASSREIVIFPYAGSLAEGYETIAVTVDSDSGYTVASPFTATATLCDTPLDAWRFLQFTPAQLDDPAQLADPAISGPDADPDNDSNPNLGEFFADSDPLAHDLGPQLRIVENSGQFHLTLRRNPAASGLDVQIEESATPTGGDPLEPQPTMAVETVNGWDHLTFAIPASGGTRRFWRARISQPASPPAEVFDYYVDSVLGNDSNNGTSPTTAFATITKALAATASNRSASVGLARGRRYVPPTSMVFGVRGTWGAFGEGHMPFIDCSLPVNVAITPHPVHANVYVAEITHAVPPFYTNNVVSNGPHVGLWWETQSTGLLGQYLLPVFGLADTTTASAEQFVKDNPGRCFVQKVGSSLPDVRTETSGSTLRYTFQLADSSDPRSGGCLRYACYHSTNITFDPGARISGIAFGRNTRKDCLNNNANATNPNIPLPTYTDCAWLDTGCHAAVSPQNWTKCLAYSRTWSRINGAGAFHNYTNVFEPRIPLITDSYIRGYFFAVYAHGIAQNPVMQSMRGARLRIEGSATAFMVPPVAEFALFEDVEINTGGYISGGPANVRRFRALLTQYANQRGIFSDRPCGFAEDGVVAFSGPSNYSIIAGFNNTSQERSESLRTPTLRRVTMASRIGSMALQPDWQQFISFHIEDSIVGQTLFTNNPDSPNLIRASTIQNSYIGPIKNGGLPLFHTLAEYQARVPGAANDVVLYDQTKPVTFAGDPLINPTITGPAEILGKGMGVDPQIILDLPAKLTNVPSLQSLGLTP